MKYSYSPPHGSHGGPPLQRARSKSPPPPLSHPSTQRFKYSPPPSRNQATPTSRYVQVISVNKTLFGKIFFGT